MAQDNPGVFIRPPRLYLGALALGLTLDYFRPAPMYPHPCRRPPWSGTASMATAAIPSIWV